MVRRSFMVLTLIGCTLFSCMISLSNRASAQNSSSAPARADTVRDAYRHFIMPTAKPVNGGYLGFWELAFLQGGVGFSDVVSLVGGFTAMPTVAFRSQFAYVQAKVTMVDEGPFSFAMGLNLLRLTSDHIYDHLFAVGTYETPGHLRFTGLFFYKLAGDNFPIVNVFPYGEFSFNYGGPIGVGAGFDAPVPDVQNLRVIAEVWNHDIESPQKVAAMVGLRVENSRFSSDFGFMYFTQPLIVPVANFVWRF